MKVLPEVLISLATIVTPLFTTLNKNGLSLSNVSEIFEFTTFEFPWKSLTLSSNTFAILSLSSIMSFLNSENGNIP